MTIMNEISSLPQKKLTPINISTVAIRVADEFVDNKTPLNDSITKAASAYDLNEEQIKRICEIANISTFNKLFDKTAEKTFEFPLADAEIVIKNKSGVGVEKVASAEVYSSRKKHWNHDQRLDKFLDIFEVDSETDSGIEKNKLEKIASRDKEEVRVVMSRLVEELRSNYEMAKYAESNAITDLRRSIKDYINEGGNPGLLVHIAGMKEGVKALLSDIFDELDQLRPKKIERQIVIPKRIIDPNHPIVIKMDTVSEHGRIRKKIETALDLYSDKTEYIRRTVCGD